MTALISVADRGRQSAHNDAKNVIFFDKTGQDKVDVLLFRAPSCIFSMWTRQMSVYIYIPAGSLSSVSRRLYDNELPSSANQLRLWLQSVLIMRRGGRGARSRSGGSSLCVFSSGCGRPESPAPNDARFFYFSTAGAPVRAAEVSPLGVLMAAWTPNATRWRWILAFVS